jgi:hypothetical protein
MFSFCFDLYTLQHPCQSHPNEFLTADTFLDEDLTPLLPLNLGLPGLLASLSIFT